MQLKIAVAEKVATAQEGAKIVCGNSDYEIAFTFDEEWNEHEVKTARFVFQRQGKTLYEDVVFEGAICPVPTLYGILEVRIGVYAGNLSTSTPAVVECEKSILCGSPVHDEPPEDPYNKIMELYEETAENAKQAEESAKRTEALVGDIDAALDELHAYAQSIVSGGEIV
jgi:hypothetical protein